MHLVLCPFREWPVNMTTELVLANCDKSNIRGKYFSMLPTRVKFIVGQLVFVQMQIALKEIQLE